MHRREVHTITISEQGLKRYFQLRIPADVECIEGIHSTLSLDDIKPIDDLTGFGLRFTPGHLQLAHPRTGETVYCETLYLPGKVISTYLLRGALGPGLDLTVGYREPEGFEPSFKLNIDSRTPLLEGYYEDYNTALSDFKSYRVNIYLTFKIKPYGPKFCA